MNEILLRPVLALEFPIAIDVDACYRLALIGVLTFLFWMMFRPSSRNLVAIIQIDLLETVGIACAWGLVVTGWRLGINTRATAISLTVLTMVSLVCWGMLWVDRF